MVTDDGGRSQAGGLMVGVRGSEPFTDLACDQPRPYNTRLVVFEPRSHLFLFLYNSNP